MTSADLSGAEIAALRQMIDRQAIVDCISRYSRGVDRADEELLRSSYHPDAVEDHGAYIGNVDGLIEYLASVHAPFAGYQRFITNHTIEIECDVAHAESYFLCILRRDGADKLFASGGRYTDRLERRNGEWLIANRVVVLEWLWVLQVVDWPVGHKLPSGSIRANGT